MKTLTRKEAIELYPHAVRWDWYPEAEHFVERVNASGKWIDLIFLRGDERIYVSTRPHDNPQPTMK